jgi:hypothetical protein
MELVTLAVRHVAVAGVEFIDENSGGPSMGFASGRVPHHRIVKRGRTKLNLNYGHGRLIESRPRRRWASSLSHPRSWLGQQGQIASSARPAES